MHLIRLVIVKRQTIQPNRNVRGINSAATEMTLDSAHEMFVMNLHAPPRNSNQTRQFGIKTISGFLLALLSLFSTLLIGPVVLGFSLIGVTAVICGAGSRNFRGESLVPTTRDLRISSL